MLVVMKSLGASILVLAASWLSGATVARATSITVTTTAGGLTVNGKCSHREALAASSYETAVDTCLAGHGADTIVLKGSTYPLSIPGQREDQGPPGISTSSPSSRSKVSATGRSWTLGRSIGSSTSNTAAISRFRN